MKRVVDLTRELVPGKEKFRLEIETFQVKDYLPGFKQGERDWHIIQDIHMCSHIGTHVEAPLHHLKKGKDAAGLPLGSLMGTAIRLDFRYKGGCAVIEEEDIRRYGEKIRKNDIVILWTGWDKYYNKPEHLHRPGLSLEATRFLVRKKIKCIGIDGSGIEVGTKTNLAQPDHHLLFKHNIFIIEELTNLGAIQNDRFVFLGLPLRVKHLDSSPIRAIAIEELGWD